MSAQKRRKTRQGQRGIPGPPGPAGKAGPEGLKGDTGLQGVEGLQGVAGRRGRTGITGAIGAIGPSGRIVNLKDVAKQLTYVDRSIENIYNEMGSHIQRMTDLQRELDLLRDTVRKLAAARTLK